MADLFMSKVKIGNDVYKLKDEQVRLDLDALEEALGSAAYKDVAESISDGDGKIADAATVKAYVDAQIESIPSFECIVCPADASKIPAGAKYVDGATVITGTMEASADTYKKIYLVKNSKESKGSYIEYLTVRSGSDPSFTYAWEMIGSTEIDLTEYVKKDTEIAGIEIQDGIDTEDLQAALGLGDLAYADSASGEVEGQTISNVKATGNINAALTGALGEADATAEITSKANYTPAGSIIGDAIKGGSVTVSVSEESATATDFTYDAYKPAGTVSLTASNTGSFQVAGTNEASVVTIEESTDTFVKSLKAGSEDAASIDTSKFDGGSAASLGTGFYTAGSDASLTGGSVASLTAQSTAKFANKVLSPSVDNETLLFSWVDSTAESAAFADAVTDRGTFTANELQTLQGGKTAVIDTSKFNGGSAASISDGFFSANKLPVVDATGDAWVGIESATAAAQTFTGSKYEPGFDGTSANIKAKSITYAKTIVDDEAEFTPVAAELTFSGTESENLIPTAIKYSKTNIGSLGVSAAVQDGGLSVGDIVVSAKNVTVNAD